jgi:hypothetical protein
MTESVVATTGEREDGSGYDDRAAGCCNGLLGGGRHKKREACARLSFGQRAKASSTEVSQSFVVEVDMPEAAHLVTPVNVGAKLGEDNEQNRFTVDRRDRHDGDGVCGPDCVEEPEAGLVLDYEERELRARNRFQYVLRRGLGRESSHARLGLSAVEEDTREPPKSTPARHNGMHVARPTYRR